ncbi:hypothetical protein ACFLXU_06605 [Chloroflexota bacterium]
MTAKRVQNKPQQATEPLKGLVIGQDWRVGADSLNIILYRRQVNNKTGKEYWRAHSYYATIANALVGLVNQGVRDTELADLKTVNKRIDEIHTWINKALENDGRSTRNATSLKEATRSRNKGKSIPLAKNRQEITTLS